MSSRSIGALAASTEKLMLSCALGTTTSPPQYQSNNSAGLSSVWATNPSSETHMWVSTLVIHLRPDWRRRLIGRRTSREPRSPLAPGELGGASGGRICGVGGPTTHATLATFRMDPSREAEQREGPQP